MAASKKTTQQKADQIVSKTLETIEGRAQEAHEKIQKDLELATKQLAGLEGGVSENGLTELVDMMVDELGIQFFRSLGKRDLKFHHLASKHVRGY